MVIGEGEAGKKALIESDFLFGLRLSDKRHRRVRRALVAHRNGDLQLRVLSSAVVEVRAVLYSRGLGPAESEDALSLMDATLAGYGVREFLPVEMADVVVAERLRLQYPGLGFFDSLHAATSRRLALPILSSEGIYRRIGISTLDLDRL